MTGLIAFVALFAIATLGMLAFEISRYSLAKNQLKNCNDAATLAASSTLSMYSATPTNSRTTGTSYSDPAVARKAQMSAIAVAMKVFQKNSVLGKPLTNAALANTLPLKPNPDQGVLYVEFLSPETNPPSPVPIGSPDGKIVRISAAYGVVPVFGRFLPISSTPVWDTSLSAVPMLDVVNCFDVGGSADDQTKVSFVKRYWKSTAPGLAGYVDYQIATKPSGGLANGTIASVLNVPARGINVNAIEPQGLENADTAPSPLKFSETQAATLNLRGVANTGSPPGNYPGPGGANNNPSTGGPDTFTDLVVNLDGNNSFAGATISGYNFPNVGVLVEAARGNLENDSVFKAAALQGNPNFVGIVPRPGYKSVGYDTNAQLALQPMNTSRNETLNFSYALLHTNNCRMGEVSFNDSVGVTDLSTFTAPNISAAYTPAGTGQFLLPNAFERPVNDALFAQYKALCTSPSARNYGYTNNAGAAIRSATAWLTNPIYHRPNADRAIVLFTNSLPSDSEMPATRAAADQARRLGIPVYCVGLRP